MEAGHDQRFREAALVDLLLPDNVVGVFGALLQDAVLDTLQDDAGVGTGALAHARLERGTRAVAHVGALQQLVAAGLAQDALLALEHGGQPKGEAAGVGAG